MNDQIEEESIQQKQSFSSDPLASYTLPSYVYFDKDLYEKEKECIFYDDWWFACHVSQVSEPGSYLTLEVQDQPILIVRTKEGELKAFFNVCQHRAHKLLKGAGNTNIISCPYHAWLYDLDGKLTRARNTQDLKNFNSDCIELKKVRLELHCGFVFINVNSNASSIKLHTLGLGEEIRQYFPKLEKFVFSRKYEYRVRSNWKVLIENFLECYHCESSHPDFVDLVDINTYNNKVNEKYVSQIAQAVRCMDSSAFKINNQKADFGFVSWFIWPNVTVWAFPGDPNILTLQMIPEGPNHTLEILNWYLMDENPTHEQEEMMRYVDKILQPEDISLCESVFHGLKSKGYDRGRLVIDKKYSQISEHAVYHFQKLVMNALNVDISR